jgi:hypothetical protein
LATGSLTDRSREEDTQGRDLSRACKLDEVTALRVAMLGAFFLGCHSGASPADAAVAVDLAPGCVPSSLAFTTSTVATFPVGSGPAYLAAADFNGDGKLDVAVSNYKVSIVSVLVGHGDGTFALPVDHPVGKGGRDLQGLAAGDFTGDGVLDLAAANTASATVTILRGDGQGGFAALPGPHATGTMPEGLIGADFNHDGKLDVALALGDGQFDLLLGDGAGGFSTLLPIATPLLAAADFNADGIVDVAGGAFAALDLAPGRSAAIVLGRGDGSFALPGNSYAVGSGPDGMAAGDFDGDGRLDLVVASFNDDAGTVLLGHGDGSFTVGQTFVSGGGPDGIAVGDLDCDGKLDVVVANSGVAFVSVFRGHGDGTFAAPLSVPAGMSPGATVIADFNGDRRADILCVNFEADTVTLLAGQ